MEQSSLSKFQNPAAYIKLFFRRKWLFIAPLFAGLTLGIVGYFVIQPNYESHTAILVEEQRTINPLIQDLAVSTSVVQRLNTIREQILGWNNLVDLVKKLSLDKKIQTQLQFEELIMDLRKTIQVQMTGNNIIRLSYTSQDPYVALAVTKTLTDIFIEENLKTQTKETDLAIDFLKEQIQVYKRKLKESEVNDLENQLKKLSADATEAHPMVKDLRQKLDAARKDLDSGEYQIADEEKPLTDPVRQALKQELEKITGETSGSSFTAGLPIPQDANAAIYKLFIMDRIDSARARDLTVNQRIYDMLLQRLETAKITQRLEASKQGTRYTIIDPARLPLKPKKPQLIWVLVGIFLGGGAGVGLVFAREFLDQSFLDIEDAKQNLDLPLLGAISRITTPEEIAAEKHRRLGWIITAVIVSAVAIIGAGLYHFLRK